MVNAAYAQPSEQILSPKKQLDNGVEPYDVICNDKLILVERSVGKIACISENMAQKLDWRVIEQISNNTTKSSESPLEKSHNVTSLSLADALADQRSRVNPSPSMFSLVIEWPTAYTNGSFTNKVYTNATFPKSVSVGDEFTIEYSWSNGTDILKDRYMLPPVGEQGRFNVSVVTSDMEFVNPPIPIRTKCDIDYLFSHILYNSDNIKDRSGNVTVRFTDIIDSTEYEPVLLIEFAAGAFIEIYALFHENGTIDLKRSIEPRPEFKLIFDCEPVNSSHTLNSSGTSIITNSSMIEKPICIHEQSWGYLYDDEKLAILQNPTTCDIVNGKYIKNLPDGWLRMEKPNFNTMISAMNIRSIDTPEEFIKIYSISGNWTDDFISYYYNISK